MTKRAYFEISIGKRQVGRLNLVLYDSSVPKTVQNFSTLITKGFYNDCKFHRVIPGFMAQGGDYTKGNGTGGLSIFGKEFEDENFQQAHDKRGILSMANSGPNTNGSQFFITFKPTPFLDNKHVVFGYVEGGEEILKAMEGVPTGRNDVPNIPVLISSCGVVEDFNVTPERHDSDADEIKLDDDEEKVAKPLNLASKKDEIKVDTNDSNNENELEADEKDDGKPKTKKQLIMNRIRRLKMKTNQAKQLNRQEVQREGERLGCLEGMAKERKRLAIDDKKRREKEWEIQNTLAFQIATEHGVDGKHMVEQASESIRKTIDRTEKAVTNQFSVKDYHNPEGQHRNYQRNLSSLPKSQDYSGDTTATFNPIMKATDRREEVQGAKRLAGELKRRLEKQAKKRALPEFEGSDVSYINQRNKRFNQKISRNYDEATAEIKQNLERGTAL